MSISHAHYFHIVILNIDGSAMIPTCVQGHGSLHGFNCVQEKMLYYNVCGGATTIHATGIHDILENIDGTNKKI